LSFDLSRPRARRGALLALVAACFVYRLAFGLSSDFWTEDERQVYLIGLQSYARQAWPYYGADVVWTQSRLPGALQGLLIAGPLAIWHAPESPIVLLNLLSFGALSAFAWYLNRRLPELPGWLVWGWLMTAPWTLHFSTHVVNTSYVLAGAIAFFIGFCEAVPALSAGLIRAEYAWALMGFGLTWILQIHFSAALLPGYVLVAAILWIKRRPAVSELLRGAAAFALGAALPGVLLLPTLLRAGAAGLGGMERNMVVQPRGVGALLSVLGRFLSFASVEINRFLGLNLPERLSLLTLHWWIAPLALVLLGAAVVQPAVLFVIGLRSRASRPEWRAVGVLAAGTVLWVYVSYWFSIREPQAHAFYLALPVATLFAMYCYAPYVGRPWVRRTLAALLVVNVVFHAGFAAIEAGERSLYQNRLLVQRAIDLRNDRLLGDRRKAASLPAALEPAPLPVPAGFDQASPKRDLTVVRADWSSSTAFGLSWFDVTIRNDGRDAAYVDLRYRVRYFGGDGQPLAESSGVLKYILEPGMSHRWPHLVDSRLIDASVQSASLELVGAEKVVPLPGL
jgi:hypothetical protein